ncbi:MAG: FG-GAP repeat domain-containing protein [Microthrixaceae bacterium]
MGIVAGVTALAAVGAGCVPPPPEVPPSPVSFTEHTVASVPRAAFVVAGDVTGGAGDELVSTSFGAGTSSPGTVSLHELGADLGDWTTTPIVTASDDIAFPNDPTITDVDGDGDADVIVPAGFFLCELSFSPCGSLQWFEQDGGSWIRHQVVDPGNARFYHSAKLADVDGDGLDDLVTVSETSSSARAEWFAGTVGPDRFETTPKVIGSGGGSLVVIHDVDGDGDEDVVSPQLFGGSGVVWFERTADPSPASPTGEWTRHKAVNFGAGFAIEHIEDLLGDGVDRWVATNHVANAGAGVFVVDQAADPTDPWATTRVSKGIQVDSVQPGDLAPGFFGVGDIDGDGENDIAVSGDGDPRIFWLRQEADDSFSTFVLDDDMGQAGGALVLDLDGNGTNEMVFSSYENDVIKIYER